MRVEQIFRAFLCKADCCYSFPYKFRLNSDWSKSYQLLLNTKVGNDSRYDSYACSLQNVLKFSFAGWTHFSSVFKYIGPLFSLLLIDTVPMKTKVFNFFDTKVGNIVRNDSYTCFFQNVLKFSFAGWTNFSGTSSSTYKFTFTHESNVEETKSFNYIKVR